MEKRTIKDLRQILDDLGIHHRIRLGAVSPKCDYSCEMSYMYGSTILSFTEYGKTIEEALFRAVSRLPRYLRNNF